MSQTVITVKKYASLLFHLSQLAGISNATEHQQALELMEELLEGYNANPVVIEVLNNVIARYNV